MMNYLRQFKLQLKIFLLERIHWLILVLALVLLFTDISFKNSNTFSPVYINNLSRSVFQFTSIVYGVLATRFFLMEVSKQSQIQWARPSFRANFVLVKFFAMFFGVLILLLPTLVMMLIRGVSFNNLAGLFQGASLWFYLFTSTFLFATVLSVLSGLLLRKPALAMPFTLISLIWLAIRQTVWPDLFKYYVSESFGLLFAYGPIRETLQINRGYFLMLSISLLLLAILIGHFILPANKGKLKLKNSILWFSFFLFFIAGTIYLGSRLNYQGSFIVDQPDLETLYKSNDVCDALDSYEVVIVINEHGYVEKGTASVQLKKGLDIHEHLLLLPSLMDKPVTVEETSPGTYSIGYEGEFILPNYSYSNLFQDPEISFVGFLPGGYVDQSRLLLLAHGQWHPFSKCDLTRLELRIPETININYSSADKNNNANRVVNLYWDENLPEVLIIGGADYVEGDLNGQKALLPEWLNSDYRSHYELIQTKFSGLMKRVALETNEEQNTIILPIVRSSVLDKNGTFFLRSTPFTMFLPDATPSKLEIEAALEVIQAWWRQGTDDPSLQNCLFKRFSCLQPTRSAPDDKSVMPFLYYFSLKLASEQSPETVDLESIIQLYQTIDSDPASIYAVPRMFDKDEENELIVKLFQLDRCMEDGEFWNVLVKLKEEKSSVWIDYEDLESSILQLTGYSLERLEQQCPQN